MTLFDQLGGQPALEGACFLFYERIMKDTRINHYFENVDISKQQKKMVGFMTHAFGGKPQEGGVNLRRSHAKYHLSDEDFDIVAGHLSDTLDELGVQEPQKQEVLAIVGSTRDEVLNR